MRRSLRAPRARAGFTLVEVLLTLLIMGWIMVSVTQILTAARTSRDTIHNIQETQLAGPAILDLLTADLRALCTYGAPRGLHLRVKDRVVSGLDGDSLDFVTTTDGLTLERQSDRYVRADLNEVGYRLRPSPANDEFLELYRREDFGVDDEPFEGGRFTFLHDRVKSFSLQVFAEDGPDEDPLDEWGVGRDEENVGLPARIEVSLVLELKPRIDREALRYELGRRTVEYKRVVRLPQGLRLSESQLPIPAVPQPPTETSQGQQPGGGQQGGQQGGGQGQQGQGGGGGGLESGGK